MDDEVRYICDAAPPLSGEVRRQRLRYVLGAEECRDTGLAERLAQLFLSAATPRTLPVVVFAYSAVLNYWVPSGGAKWAMEAPYLLKASAALGVAPPVFALQTRSKAEQIEQRLHEAERTADRRKLTQTEKELSSLIYERTGGNKNFAFIRSGGDHALFGKFTQTTIILKAKGFATEITIFNTLHHEGAAKVCPTREETE